MGVSVPSRRHPSTRRARCRAWLPLGDPRRRRAGIHGADVCRLVHRAPRAIHYIQPGRPDQDAYIERVNRSYRAEVLNADLFESLAELRALTDTWLRIYNSARPHDSLGRVPPLTFLPRPSSAGQVSPCTVYLTGKLTYPGSDIEGTLFPTVRRSCRLLVEGKADYRHPASGENPGIGIRSQGEVKKPSTSASRYTGWFCSVATCLSELSPALSARSTFARPTTSSTNFSLATAVGERTNGYASPSPSPRFKLFKM